MKKNTTTTASASASASLNKARETLSQTLIQLNSLDKTVSVTDPETKKTYAILTEEFSECLKTARKQLRTLNTCIRKEQDEKLAMGETPLKTAIFTRFYTGEQALEETDGKIDLADIEDRKASPVSIKNVAYALKRMHPDYETGWITEVRKLQWFTDLYIYQLIGVKIPESVKQNPLFKELTGGKVSVNFLKKRLSSVIQTIMEDPGFKVQGFDINYMVSTCVNVDTEGYRSLKNVSENEFFNLLVDMVNGHYGHYSTNCFNELETTEQKTKKEKEIKNAPVKVPTPLDTFIENVQNVQAKA